MVTNIVVPISAHNIGYDVVFGRPNYSLLLVATITSMNALNDALNNLAFQSSATGNRAAKSLHCPQALLFELIPDPKRWVMKPGTLLQFYDKMHNDANATYQVKSVAYASSVGRSTGGEVELQAATKTISISLPLLFCLPNEKGQNFWQEIQKNALKYASFSLPRQHR